MPRRDRHRTMKGGFWESLTQGVSDAWNKTKKATTDAYSSATGSTATGSSTYEDLDINLSSIKFLLAIAG